MEPPDRPQSADGVRPRARDLGIAIGRTAPGPFDAITDVPGVRVGHTTVRRPPDVDSGVTAVVPDGVGPRTPPPAGVFTGNGYGKLIGTTQLTELGTLETPVLLTSTLSAFRRTPCSTPSRPLRFLRPVRPRRRPDGRVRQRRLPPPDQPVSARHPAPDAGGERGRGQRAGGRRPRSRGVTA
ncbi:hypothetical protein A4U61_15010 [Streptomyces sp. H-KF8]|nr:hypothetical protein A4U61_15010 [Streptomyces sp. H-KF8]